MGESIDWTLDFIERNPITTQAHITDLEEQLAKREADIREMIEKAAAKHRPAYDEQQRKIFGLEQQLAEANHKLEWYMTRFKPPVQKPTDQWMKTLKEQ